MNRCGKHRAVLFRKHCQFGGRGDGKHCPDADAGGDGIQHGRAGRDFGGQVPPCLLEQVGVRLKFAAGLFAQGQRLPHCTVGSGGREQDVGAEEDAQS